MTEKIYGDGAFRRESLQGSTIENTYAGALSFMRRRYTRDLSEADVVVSGVPLDLATTFRPGARLGACVDSRCQRAAGRIESFSVGL